MTCTLLLFRGPRGALRPIGHLRLVESALAERLLVEIGKVLVVGDLTGVVYAEDDLGFGKTCQVVRAHSSVRRYITLEIEDNALLADGLDRLRTLATETW